MYQLCGFFFFQSGEPAAKKAKADAAAAAAAETKTVKKAMSFVGLADALKVRRNLSPLLV
jgi:hypothetical protein